MIEKSLLIKTRILLSGLVAGMIFGCNKSNDLIPTIIPINTLTYTQTEVVTISPLSTSTYSKTPELTSTPSLTLTSTSTNTPLPLIRDIIPATNCGDHMTYSANTEITKIPIIEDDKIVEYARYILVIYKIKNTYTNSPVYGFEVRPSPGYDNPDLYPDQSPMFTSDPLIQPNEEVILKSEHIFMPKGWSSEKHPSAFLKFPENISPPYRYGDAKEGDTITFQIVEQFGMIDSNKEEIRCDGAIRVK